MAKKIGNMILGGVLGSFMLLFMGGFLFNADSITESNTDKIGSDLQNIGLEATASYRDTEKALQENTFEGGVFALPDEKLVETRGISQGNIISKDSPSNIKQTIKSVANKSSIPPTVQFLLASLIIITGIILLIRVIRGESAT